MPDSDTFLDSVVLQSNCPRVTFLGPYPTRPDPGETLTRPDPRLPTKSPTRPPICTMFHEFNIQVANMEQYTIVA